MFLFVCAVFLNFRWQYFENSIPTVVIVWSGTERVNDAPSTADILKCGVINKLKIVCPLTCHVTEVHEGAEKFQVE
jgi:hypothetical protein